MPLELLRWDRRGQDVRSFQRIVRLVEAVSGECIIDLNFRPSFDYARGRHELSVAADGAIAWSGNSFLSLSALGVEIQPDGAGGVRAQLNLRAGERRWIALTHARDEQAARAALRWTGGEAELKSTLDYWEWWSARCTYRGRYRDVVLRSALVLKLLTYEPSGAIVAAPTTSLPERIGGVRNRDYRFNWLRDASLMLYALLTIGHHDEAADFFEWLERVEEANPRREPQIMYTIDGGWELPEQTLDHLDGYRGSRPVRIGNAAVGQRQLDVFGEVLASAHLYFSSVEQQMNMDGFDPAFSVAAYGKAFVNAVVRALTFNTWVGVAVLALAGWFATDRAGFRLDKRAGLVMAALVLAVLAKFVVFPIHDGRIYFPNLIPPFLLLASPLLALWASLRPVRIGAGQS